MSFPIAVRKQVKYNGFIMQGNILIIEDVKKMSDLISLYLSREGFEIKAAKSGEEGFTVIEGWKPELVILDINLPGMDGYEFLQKFRRVSNTPVVIVSARDSDEDQINGLGIGADEYIIKPFSIKVLVARVRALFRRFKDFSETRLTDEENQENVLCFGPFILNYDLCILIKNGERVRLTTKEYACLACLAENPGKPMDVESIYKNVWKNNYGDLTTVAVYIQRLRKKIEDDPANPIYIRTVHGMGYRFGTVGETAL